MIENGSIIFYDVISSSNSCLQIDIILMKTNVQACARISRCENRGATAYGVLGMSGSLTGQLHVIFLCYFFSTTLTILLCMFF